MPVPRTRRVSSSLAPMMQKPLAASMASSEATSAAWMSSARNRPGATNAACSAGSAASARQAAGESCASGSDASWLKAVKRSCVSAQDEAQLACRCTHGCCRREGCSRLQGIQLQEEAKEVQRLFVYETRPTGRELAVRASGSVVTARCRAAHSSGVWAQPGA